MEITAEEAIFIAYREDLKAFHSKWKKTFDSIGYLNVPTSVSNSMLAVDREVIAINYKIQWERNKK